MTIESIPMIDRLKRAHMALMSNCLEAQLSLNISSELYLQLEVDILECSKIINRCEEILNDDKNS